MDSKQRQDKTAGSSGGGKRGISFPGSRFITKIDRYILGKFFGTFFFVILLMAVIAGVIDFSEKASHFIGGTVPNLEIAIYFKNFIPHIVALLFALFIFIATIFFTSKMAYKSEIIAILASGASFNRFLRPYFVGATVICGTFLLANHWIVPNANKARLAFENKYIHNAVVLSDRNVHLRLSKDLFVYVESYDYTINSGYRFAAEKIDSTALVEKITADRVSYDSVNKTWKLFNVMIRRNNGLKEEIRLAADMTVPYPFTPKDLRNDEDIKETLTTPELDAFIAREKARGRESLNFYYVEKYRRTAQPAAGFILCIIGACISCRKIRGGSGFHLALGIVISAVYMMLLQFSTTFSTKADLNPMLAVWIPNIIFAIVAFALYRREAR
jgi:lipopolysaccharide export system permease protein